MGIKRKRFKVNLNLKFEELGFKVIQSNYLFIHYEKDIRIRLTNRKSWEVFHLDSISDIGSTSLKKTYEEVKERFFN